MFENVSYLPACLYGACIYNYIYIAYIYILTTLTLCVFLCIGHKFDSIYHMSLAPNTLSFPMQIKKTHNCRLPCSLHAQMRWRRWSSRTCLIQSARSLSTTRRCWKPRIRLLSMSCGACDRPKQPALPTERCPHDWPKAIWVSFKWIDSIFN